MNSKTTWFTKLFRGDSSDRFRLVPESEASDGENSDSGSAHRQDRLDRPPASASPLDPDVQTPMNRIEQQGDFTFSPRVAEYKANVQAKAEAAALSTAPVQAGSLVPFFERRSEQHKVEPDDLPMMALAVVEPAAEVQEEKAKAASSGEATPSCLPESSAAIEPEPRPLRPLSFQQLAGLEPIPAPADPIRQAKPEASPTVPDAIVHTIKSAVPAFAPHPEGKLAARWTSREPNPVALEPALHTESEIAAFAQPDVWDTGAWSADEMVPVPRRVEPRLSSRPYRMEAQPDEPSLSVPEPVVEEPWEWLGAPRSEVPTDTVIAPNPEMWARNFGRRATDRVGPNGEPLASGRTREWALLNRFEHNVSDPSPTLRRRSTDFPPRHTGEAR